MKVKLTVLIIIFYIFNPLLWSQVTHYTVDDGLATGEVRQMIELPNGQIMVNSEGVFELFDGNTFKTVPCSRRQLYHLKNYKGYYHLWQGDSLLWLRDFYHLYVYDMRLRKFRYDVYKRVESNSTLRQMVEGNLSYKPCDSTWQNLADSIGANSHVECALVDRQGGRWVGTISNGIYYLPPKRNKVNSLAWNESLFNLIFGIKDSKGGLWRATSDGLKCITKGETIVYSTKNVRGFIHSRMLFIIQLKDGRLLLCNHAHHIGYFNPERRSFEVIKAVMPQLEKYRILVGACPLSVNRVVVYAQNGAFVLNTQKNTVETFTPQEIINDYSDKYNCIIKDRKGKLWIGTQNGLFVYDGKRTKRFSTSNGLGNNCIRSLVEDGEGQIWVGTSVGISRINKEGIVTNLGVNDGVSDDYMLERGARLMQNGELAFAKNKELILFQPKDFDPPKKKYRVALTEIIVNDKVESLSKSLTLDYNQNYLTFTFSAFNYARPEQTHYRYRMKGLDDKWSYIYNNHGNGKAYYTALSPGNYILNVQASADGGGWGPVLCVNISILPPWWLTWWAKLLYLTVVIVIISIVIRSYLRRKKRQLEKANESKVNQLFELRDEARRQFVKNVKIDPRKIGICQEEEDLVGAMMKAIEANMDNAEYTVDQLASDIALSRSNLYRRTQTILGITPSDFIRNVRLKHAAYLLAETDLPVNQVAMSIGFSSSSHFSQCFKKMFGVLPSEYKKSPKDSV